MSTPCSHDSTLTNSFSGHADENNNQLSTHCSLSNGINALSSPGRFALDCNTLRPVASVPRMGGNHHHHQTGSNSLPSTTEKKPMSSTDDSGGSLSAGELFRRPIRLEAIRSNQHKNGNVCVYHAVIKKFTHSWRLFLFNRSQHGQSRSGHFPHYRQKLTRSPVRLLYINFEIKTLQARSQRFLSCLREVRRLLLLSLVVFVRKVSPRIAQNGSHFITRHPTTEVASPPPLPHQISQ